MIDRRLGPIYVRRGTEVERKVFVVDEGEFVYSTDKTRLFIGDGTTDGGILVSNKNFITNTPQSSIIPLSEIMYGDIIFNKFLGKTYIIGYDVDGVTLIPIQIADLRTCEILTAEYNALSAKFDKLKACLKDNKPLDKQKDDPDSYTVDPNTPTISVKYCSPHGMAINSIGDFFIADTNNNCIRKINKSGVVSTFATVDGLLDNIQSSTRFNKPIGLVFDSDDNLYVANSKNGTIIKISKDGTATTFSSKFVNPTWMAIDNKNKAIYVTDTSQNVIKKIDFSGNVTLYAGIPGVSGNVLAERLKSTFTEPKGIALDSNGSLFVCDEGNQVIKKITDTEIVDIIAGKSGTTGYLDAVREQATFFNPGALSIDSEDNLYIADTGNFKIRKIDIFSVVTTCLKCTLGTPQGLFVDHEDSLYISESSNIIRKLDKTSNVNIFSGTLNQCGFVNTDGSPKTPQGDGTPSTPNVVPDLDYVNTDGKFYFKNEPPTYLNLYIGDSAKIESTVFDSLSVNLKTIPFTPIPKYTVYNTFKLENNKKINIPTSVVHTIDNIYDTTGVLANVNIKSAGTYYVTADSYFLNVSNDRVYFQSITSEPVFVNVFDKIEKPTIVVQPNSQNTTPLVSKIFLIEATGTQPLNYQWYENGVPIEGQTSNVYKAISPVKTVTLKCRVSNSAGYVDSMDVILTVNTE